MNEKTIITFDKLLKSIDEKLRELPNRDEMIQKHSPAIVSVFDGGGIGRFDTLDIINDEFKKHKKMLQEE